MLKVITELSLNMEGHRPSQLSTLIAEKFPL